MRQAARLAKWTGYREQLAAIVHPSFQCLAKIGSEAARCRGLRCHGCLWPVCVQSCPFPDRATGNPGFAPDLGQGPTLGMQRP